jgi:hypothetical protein
MPGLSRNENRNRCVTTRCHKNRSLPPLRFSAARGKGVLLAAILLEVVLASAVVLSSCGSSGGSTSSQNDLTLAGNWQFTMAAPPDGSFLGGLQGGFLQQSSGSVMGTAGYAVALSQLLIPCSSGSATINGTISGANVTLTAMAGTQTFTFTGTLSLDRTPILGSTTFIGETMSGNYSSTAGTATDGAPCGTAQSGLQWSAILVPPITGTFEGTMQSIGGAAGLSNQDFPVSGSLTQGAISGASATVTGTLNFVTSDYPCFNTGSDAASLSGQISGNSVNLQMVGTDGSILGEIGETVGPNGVTGMDPVTFNSAQNGYVMNAFGPSYLVATTACQGTTNNTTTAGDYGYICLAVQSPLLGGANSCPQAVTLSPSSLTFPGQALSTSSTLPMTLTNTSGATLNNLTLVLAQIPAGSPANFLETDNCGPDGAPSNGKPFGLDIGPGCVVTVIFDPKQTCATGSSQCPSAVTATLSVNESLSAGSNPNEETLFIANLTGTGVN